MQTIVTVVQLLSCFCCDRIFLVKVDDPTCFITEMGEELADIGLVCSVEVFPVWLCMGLSNLVIHAILWNLLHNDKGDVSNPKSNKCSCSKKEIQPCISQGNYY